MMWSFIWSLYVDYTNIIKDSKLDRPLLVWAHILQIFGGNGKLLVLIQTPKLGSFSASYS